MSLTKSKVEIVFWNQAFKARVPLKKYIISNRKKKSKIFPSTLCDQQQDHPEISYMHGFSFFTLLSTPSSEDFSGYWIILPYNCE